ncbi:MAG: AI-2E family transporter [Coriobacteriales bacterium]|jgi:predicted PurR-regulated permease PerM|nr:AI-2E family transporter [Coriobacteriales bacterium]
MDRIKHLCFFVWAIIGIVLLVGASIYLLGQVVSAIAIVLISVFIVFVLRAPVAWLERHGVPRLPGSLLAYLGALILVATILLVFIPLISDQAYGFIKLVPDYVAQATTAFNDFYHEYRYLLDDSNIQQMVSGAASDLSAWAGNMVSQSAQGLINFGTNVVTTAIVISMSLIVGFWVLKDLPKIGREMRIVIGPKREEDALFIASALSRAFGGYLRGITIASICTGTIAGIGYYLIGLPYPAVLGLFTGLMNFIPYVGPWVAGIIAALIGLFVSPVAALLSIIATVLAQQIVDNFIQPRVMSSTVDLHPSVVLVGVFAGGAIGGVVGLIAAIPLLSAVRAIFVHYFEKRTGRQLSSEKGALFKSASVKPPQHLGDEGDGGSADADGGADSGGAGDAVNAVDAARAGNAKGAKDAQDVASAGGATGADDTQDRTPSASKASDDDASVAH